MGRGSEDRGSRLELAHIELDHYELGRRKFRAVYCRVALINGFLLITFLVEYQLSNGGAIPHHVGCSPRPPSPPAIYNALLHSSLRSCPT